MRLLPITVIFCLCSVSSSVLASNLTVKFGDTGLVISDGSRAVARIASVRTVVNGRETELPISPPNAEEHVSSCTAVCKGQGYKIKVRTEPTEGKPRIRMVLTAVNTLEGAKQIDAAVRIERLTGQGTSALVFGSKNRLTGIPLRQKLTDGAGLSMTWGIDGFYPSTSNELKMYLPVVAIDGPPSLAVMCNPGSSFAFNLGPNSVTLSHRFFLGPKLGSEDPGLNFGGKTGFAPCEIYIGSVESISWDDLYWDFYADAFPSMISGPTIDPGPILSGSLSGFKCSDRWLARLRSFGLRTIGLANVGMSDAYATRMNMIDLTSIHRAGLKAFTSIDRFTGDLETQKGYGFTDGDWEPSLLWQNVRDSLILNADGTHVRSWWGAAVNMSPEFSYGRTLLAMLKRKIARSNYDGLFIDYYLDGAGIDGTRKYEQYPFCPTAVSDSRFLEDLSEWLHARGKFLHLNCVPEGSLLLRYADSHSCDMSVEEFFRMKLVTGPKQLVALGGSTFPENAFTSIGWLRSGMYGLFFGCIVPPWAFQPQGADAMVNNVYYLLDPEKGRPLFARNAYFGYALSRAMPVGGNAESMTSLFYRTDDSAYLAYRNMSDNTASWNVDFTHKRLGIVPDKQYTLFRWDPDKGATLLKCKVSGKELMRSIPIELSTKQMAFLCAVPYRKANNLGYAAFLGADMPYVRSATDAIQSADLNADGSITFKMDGERKVMANLDIAMCADWPVASVDVRGTEEHSVRVEDGTIGIAARLVGPMTVTLYPVRGSMTAMKPGTVVHSRQTGSQIALSGLNAESGEWVIKDGRVSLNKPTTTASTIRLSGQAPSSYSLEFTFARTSSSSSPTPRVGVVMGKMDGRDVSIEWSDAFVLSVDHNRELARGIETAMHPNQYTKYFRSYRLRIDKIGSQVGVYLSYDDGLSFEDVASFDLPQEMIHGSIGLSLVSSSGWFDDIRLSNLPVR